ncbi:Pol protein [Phytophthora palmivora]|uniref:Pol protein n=1 Tax=Phytophthora palmivora TaxID=4796 RepID=A0A2P4Y440_9STRA|nr:Pol protein [Phytophthora palmivora]
MQESDIPLTAVSTPSGMLWEWLVMPQGLSNAPATFNRLITQLFRPLRTFAQTYVDEIFVHSCTEDSETAMEVHFKHIRRACVFVAKEIKILGCFASKVGVRADPGNVTAIAAWPTPRPQRTSESGANYLPKYSAGYAKRAGPLLDLLKKDHQDAFDSTKASSQHAPVLDLPDENKSFSVVCDFSDYAIGCALLQKDDEGRECVISFQFRQQKAAERNYPVHDKELLAMNAPFGPKALCDYTNHASLRTATNSPHISQRMAGWLSFFAEYIFGIEYKPGKLNVLADGLSRRPGYGLPHIRGDMTDLYDRIRLAYQGDENYTSLVRFLPEDKGKVDRLSPRQRARPHRYELADGLLRYRVDPLDLPRVAALNNEDMKYDILLEAHDAPVSGHLGRERIYQAVPQTLWWPRTYKWVVHYVKTCETCQRMKPLDHASAPLHILLVPSIANVDESRLRLRPAGR